MRGVASLYWKLVAWNYRRQARSQNLHAACVNQRIAELTNKARAADRRARDGVGEVSQ